MWPGKGPNRACTGPEGEFGVKKKIDFLKYLDWWRIKEETSLAKIPPSPP
jgi:hypothetical protein